MDNLPLDRLKQEFLSGGPAAVIAKVREYALSHKNYPLLFECALLERRRELGLPLIATGAEKLDERLRKAMDDAAVAAARQTGTHFLTDGDLGRAWPYFRAIGEVMPVREALQNLEPPANPETWIEIAFHERVHPARGFALALETYGTCRAISFFEQFPGADGKPESLALLVNTLYDELRRSLRRAIEQHEPDLAQDLSVRQLIEGRDWLFGEHDYYVDTSHVVAVLRFCLDAADPAVLEKGVEMAEYGDKLSAMFRFRTDPPFEDCYRDHRIYLEALLGRGTGEAVEHFSGKLNDEDPMPAQVLVVLLVRLDRAADALRMAREHLSDIDASQLMCPSIPQLCQLAEDFESLEAYARENEDPLSLAAAVIQQGASQPTAA